MIKKFNDLFNYIFFYYILFFVKVNLNCLTFFDFLYKISLSVLVCDEDADG